MEIITATKQSIVSLYKRINIKKNCEYVEFGEIMKMLSDAEFWKDVVDPLQQIGWDADKKTIDEYKEKHLPYFTGSGSFSERKTDGLIEHSGKLIIDFDKKPNNFTPQTLLEARKKLESDKFSEYVFLSCSGTGLAVVVDIHPEKHLDTFLWLEKYYANTYGLKVDPSCKDVTRPRYITYDPNLYYNSNALTCYPQSATTTVDTDEEKFEWVLNLHNKKHQFVEGNRHHYLVVLAFFCNKVGISKSYTSSEFLSRFQSPEKTQKEINNIITYCYNNAADHGTFVISKKVKELPAEFDGQIKKIHAYAHAVNRAGRPWNEQDVEQQCAAHLLSKDIVKSIFISVFEHNQDQFDIDNKSDLYRVENFIARKWELLKNEITGRVEGRTRGSNDKLLTVNEHSITRALKHEGFKVNVDSIKSLMKSDFIEVYNPFVTYFQSLPEWDSVDYIGQLASYVDTTDNVFWAEQFKKALVRHIACSVFGFENRIVIVLVSEVQGQGKSTFIRYLNPPDLSYYYTEASLTGSKDAEIQLSQNFIWNMEDLDDLPTWEIAKMKSTISKAKVKERAAWAEYAESSPRRCNFWGSTNKKDFLQEGSNTRWLCFEIKGINHNYSNRRTGDAEVNINDVWAQAWALYNAGYNYRLEKEEFEVQAEANKNFERTSTEQDLLLKYMCPGAQFMTTTSILLLLQEFVDQQIKLNPIQLGKALKGAGFVQKTMRVGGAPVKGWLIAQKKTNDFFAEPVQGAIFTNKPL